MSHSSAEDGAVCEVVHQLGLLLVEDSGHKVGTVLGSLTGPKVVHYLTPMWIASHSDVICGFFVFLHNSHAVQEAAIVPERAANMAGGEDLLTKPRRPMVIGEDSIRSGYYMLPDIVVGVSSEFFLIQRHPVELHVFCHLIHDDYKLLEQPVTIVNQIEILHSFYCPLLPAGEMEDCKVTSSETFVAVRALLQARVPTLGARREQQGEVKRHGTLVLLGDNLKVPIPLGDHQVMSSIIAEHADLLQADRTIVVALVFACWSSTCRDHQPTSGQLFIQNLNNLAVVLDVGIISLEEFLYFKEDFTKLASLLNRNVLRYREIGKPCGKLQSWVKDIELGEDWSFSIPCLQGPKQTDAPGLGR